MRCPLASYPINSLKYMSSLWTSPAGRDFRPRCGRSARRWPAFPVHGPFPSEGAGSRGLINGKDIKCGRSAPPARGKRLAADPDSGPGHRGPADSRPGGRGRVRPFEPATCRGILSPFGCGAIRWSARDFGRRRDHRAQTGAGGTPGDRGRPAGRGGHGQAALFPGGKKPLLMPKTRRMRPSTPATPDRGKVVGALPEFLRNR